MASFLDPVLSPENEYANDPRRIVPYLLRLYASYGAEQASELTGAVMDALIGHSEWPSGSSTYIAATMKRMHRVARPSDGIGACGSIQEAEINSDRTLAKPMHPVDQALVDSGNFTLALQQLYVDQPEWLRGVFYNSLRAAEAAQNQADGLVWRRLQLVGAALKWGHGELSLVRFAMHTGEIPAFAKWFDALPENSRDGPRAVARMLNMNASILRKRLESGSALDNSGLYLMRRRRDRTAVFTDPPRLHPKLLVALKLADFDLKKLSELLFSKSPASTLSYADFSHLQSKYAPLETLLRRISESRERGVHILIYGPPGTRKTEFARWLVSQADWCSFEVPLTDGEEGEEGGGRLPVGDRLALLRSAHRLLRKAKRTALIFDEAEDAFPHGEPLWTGSHGLQDVAHRLRRGSTNQLLKASPMPTIWISNAACNTGPKSLWRFAYELEVRLLIINVVDGGNGGA